MSDDVVATNNNDTEETTESETALSEGRIIDLITGERELKDTPKEQVRQFIAQALKNQYNIPYEDMESDFFIGGKLRKVEFKGQPSQNPSTSTRSFPGSGWRVVPWPRRVHARIGSSSASVTPVTVNSEQA